MPCSKVVAVIALVAALPGCRREADVQTQSPEGPTDKVVVVYTALDRQFSEPILDDFTSATGIKVLAVYDTESTKTIGLLNRIRAEAHRPRCDVFWNNEILGTIRLKNEGLVQVTHPAQAENYPKEYRDPQGYWYGFAARARVIIVNTDLVKPEEFPTSINDLADPKWRGRIGMAKPLFGTTASHVAVLFAELGKDRARALLESFKANDLKVVAGNKTCADMVAAGELAFGFTDTDDALIVQESGKPVSIIFPDAAKGQMGTLLLPNTLALIKDCPHRSAGARLIDYLLSPDVEERLAQGPSGQIPLHAAAKTRSRVADLAAISRMKTDFASAAQAFGAAAEFIEREFLTR